MCRGDFQSEGQNDSHNWLLCLGRRKNLARTRQHCFHISCNHTQLLQSVAPPLCPIPWRINNKEEGLLMIMCIYLNGKINLFIVSQRKITRFS
jgi:hypothetical protein